MLAVVGCAHAGTPVADSAQCAETEVAADSKESETKATAGTESAIEIAAYIESHYVKREVQIPMRDGVTLFTSIYLPRDRSASKTYPILMNRTPYSVGPYGEDKLRQTLGPSTELMRDGYIFVYQDVRGRFMSQGEFVNMTPHKGAARKAGATDATDESTDTFDTIEWLLKNLDGHNGRVGQWGISYPGFYAAAGMIDAHPALIAVSPQAPIADWYFDDFHHHGTFWLPHAFNFLATFGRKREGPTTSWGPRFDHKTADGYAFFMRLGSLANANVRYFHDEIGFWNDIVAHPDYDSFWEERNLLPHLDHVAPAVLTVGGWFDAEDLYGPLQIYRAIERKQGAGFNGFVMGPWPHGGWARGDGDALGNVNFGSATSAYYRLEVEREFFEHFLKDKPTKRPVAEATVFETGVNRWHHLDVWPPKGTHAEALYLGPKGTLAWDAAVASGGFDEFISDPAKPVPFTEDVEVGMTRPYMTDDQRGNARRPDVLTFVSPPLDKAVTLAGPLTADLWVSTSQGDADWIVKLIDIYPEQAPDHEGMDRGKHMSEFHMLVRSEAFRGRYRESYAKPKPFVRDQPTKVRVPLQDVLHTFQPGHRIAIQIQSSWFPLIDRNPQRWVANIFAAKDEDFVAAKHRVYHSSRYPTRIEVGVAELP